MGFASSCLSYDIIFTYLCTYTQSRSDHGLSPVRDLMGRLKEYHTLRYVLVLSTTLSDRIKFLKHAPSLLRTVQSFHLLQHETLSMGDELWVWGCLGLLLMGRVVRLSCYVTIFILFEAIFFCPVPSLFIIYCCNMVCNIWAIPLPPRVI